jgi:hypothetical protein
MDEELSRKKTPSPKQKITKKRKLKLILKPKVSNTTRKSKSHSLKKERSLDKNNIEACREKDAAKKSLDEHRRIYNEKHKLCEQEFHKLLLSDWTGEDTVENLVRFLYDYYTKKKRESNAYTISLRTFVLFFPRDSGVNGHNFKRQHVFEQICRVMLLLNYDKTVFGPKKEFYSSLEKYTPSMKPLTPIDIYESKINEGSAGQSVDIFFKLHRAGSSSRIADQPSCEAPTEEKTEAKDKFVLIQNKFYGKEYSSADKYDVTKIAHRAKKFGSDEFHDSDWEINLMVNNKQSLDEKIRRNRNDDFGLVDRIFGLDELDPWFQDMVFDMVRPGSKDFKSFLGLDRANDNPKLRLRFHQDLIVNTTNAILESKTKKIKFIWGCVPRSGKSYMIAGLIDKRNTEEHGKPGNNILLILGAKSETETQFRDMFNKFDNFKDYGIVSTANDMKKAIQKKKSQFIFILSQENIKVNRKGKAFEQKFRSSYSKLFDNKNIDIYFDEIHKGGSTEKAQEKIIESFIAEKFKIHSFIMVTATYARPSIAYETLLSHEQPIILKWSYIDQQIMKQITNEQKREEFSDIRNNDIEKKEIEKLFLTYESRYGSDYLQNLEDEYKKTPELVLIQPYIDNTREQFNIHGNTFRLKCSAIGKTVTELKNPNAIFENNEGVIKLLNFIGKVDNANKSGGKTLSPDSIYGNLYHKYDYDVINKRHTQLWFLPDKGLYVNPTECKHKNMKVSEKTGYEDEDVDEDEGDNPENNTMPNIEPLTRGLVLNLLDTPFYKEHFCFLIVHNQNTLDYSGKNKNGEIFDKKVCVKTKNDEKKDPISEIIKKFEEETFRNDKSLIILTGSMLRLGISLPCADIGFNFDNVMSVDYNYQTMFRVLTERENKKYGYYFDFYPERSIKFLYTYNDTYGDGMKNITTTASLVTKLQSLLYLFNYNGLSVGKMDDEKATLQLYDKLITTLELTETAYSKHFMTSNVFEKNIKSILRGNLNQGLLIELKKIKISKKNRPSKIGKSSKIDVVLREGKPLEYALLEDEHEEKRDDDDDDDEDEDDEDDEDEDDADARILNIRAMVSIIALFSSERNYNCNSLKECIDKIISNVEDVTNICECAEEKIDVLGCYLQGLENYTIKDYKKALQTMKSIIDNDAYDDFNRSITIYFDMIRNNIGMNDNLILTMTAEDIQNKIKEYLLVRKAEKDKYGEVFTPASLINEMLDQLPKSVWTNPNLKWLDPANGTGNFPMLIFERLNEGLKEVEGYTDETERKKHIIENMLFMVEINEKNVGVSKKIFGPRANIYCGSFLDEKNKKGVVEKEAGWKTDSKFPKHFDIIIGNPPFNKTQVGTRVGGRGGRTLWNKFIFSSLDILKETGYLCFINPAGWRGLGENHELWEVMKKKQLLYLHIYGKKDGKRVFNVGTRFDIYLLQNKNNTKPTHIIDENNEEHHIQVNTWNFFPNYYYKNIKSILTTPELGIPVIHSSSFYDTRKLKNNKTDIYKYPIMHSITKDPITISWYTDDITKGHFGVSKVILNFNENQYSHKKQNDYKGEYGMSQISFGIPISSEKEGNEILEAVDTIEFKEIIKATKWGAFQTDYRMFKYFKKDWYKILLQNESKIPSGNAHSAPEKKQSRKLSRKKRPHSDGKMTRKQG